METIQITVDAKEVEQLLNHLLKRVEDLSPVMASIAGNLSDVIEQNFETEGERLGEKWQKLDTKSKTRKKKKAENTDDMILQNEGDLITSFVPGNTKTEAFIATDSPYSAIHNFGGDTGRNHSVTMPQREFAVLTDDDISEIYKTVFNFLN